MTEKVNNIHRPKAECNSLDEILTMLSSGKHPEMHYVGKNYTKANLIRDLKKLDRADEELECPKCQEPLYDSRPGVLLHSMPPQKMVACTVCDYNGTVVA